MKDKTNPAIQSWKKIICICFLLLLNILALGGGGGLVAKWYLTIVTHSLLCPWDFPGNHTGAGCPSPGDLPYTRIEPTSPPNTCLRHTHVSFTASGFFTTETPGKPTYWLKKYSHILANSSIG